MSKTPLKQADATLVQGAYNAAAAGIPRDGQDGMAQGMDKLMEISNEAVKTIAANRAAAQKEGNDLANKILDMGGSLGTSWLDVAQGEVSSMHGNYRKAAAFGRKNETAKGMQDLNTLSAEIATVKELNTSIAEAQSNNDWSLSATDKEQKVFNAFMNNDSKKRISKDKNGNRVFEVYTGDETLGNKGWMTTQDISRMVDDHKKDFKTMVGLRERLINSKSSGAARSAMGSHVQGDFDLQKNISQIDNELKQGNLKSLIYDDVLEDGVPFAKAIEQHPTYIGMTYESLGINPNTNSQQGAYRKLPKGQGPSTTIDLNNDGIIQENEMTLLSPQDRELIKDALINPDNDNFDADRTRGLMAEYFGLQMQQNYNQGFNSNAASQLPLEYYTNQLS
jgi:hypothetical protein